MKTGKVESDARPFATKAKVVLESTNVAKRYDDGIVKIANTIAEFQQGGSNWQFVSVVKLEINSFRYVPLRGRSYIPLPKELAVKKQLLT